ncbi:kinase-like domain-containing protein [Gigaspora rosea]|uniref:Kinase-like domain-containing protein n=1 Tax=Gigaspora rosea TaxID=44941 RepID=A0A397VYP8_9GLOM|nr:kinase-like domain-containing protein [Gigaspora rosea]
MGSVISTLKVKKRSIRRLTFNNKNKLLIKPFEEDYDSEDSIDRLSVEDLNKEDEDHDHGVCKLRQKGREEYGTCQVCNRFNTNYDWCHYCDTEKLTQGWTSGDKIIDKFIKKTQKKAEYYTDLYLEWIPIESIAYIQKIDQDKTNFNYSAIWLEGEREYKKLFYPWMKGRSPPIKVMLKTLPNSDDLRDLLNELKTHYKNAKSSDPINVYGITYITELGKYMMVIEYFDYGDLRDYLKINFSELKWKSKLYLLESLARGLSKLHYFEKSIHKDFHTGNILMIRYLDEEDNETIKSKIYKSRVYSKELNEENKKIYGVLPYIAPEILNGQKYKEVTDVYGFGMIMIEISGGNPPFYDHPHNFELANKICKGIRPTCPEGTPECFVELVNECLDSDPENRPATDVILRDIVNWKDIIYSDDIEELSEEQLKIRKEFEEADKLIPDIATNAYKNMHPKTVWKSQYLKLPKLPDSQKNEDLDDIILFESEELQESHKNHDTVKAQN